MNAPTPTTLFRARFPYVCDRCDIGYRAGRLAGWGQHHRMECATCLVGSDPDNETSTTSQESAPCPTSSNTGNTESTSPDNAATHPCLPDMPD